MNAVTPSRKRGMTVFVCIGCDKLAMSERSNALTCSPACRTRIHRHPECMIALTNKCAPMRLPPQLVLQAEALRRLRPDLIESVRHGDIELDATRADMVKAMMNLLQGAA